MNRQITQDAGQKVVREKTVLVKANQPWVDSTLTISPGMKLWVDTRSDGQWSGGSGAYPLTDANGLASCALHFQVYANALPLSLIGFIGNSPPTPHGHGVEHPGLIGIGNTLLNHAPKTTGRIWLRINDNQNSNSDSGQQTVRIVVTSVSKSSRR